MPPYVEDLAEFRESIKIEMIDVLIGRRDVVMVDDVERWRLNRVFNAQA